MPGPRRSRGKGKLTHAERKAKIRAHRLETAEARALETKDDTTMAVVFGVAGWVLGVRGPALVALSAAPFFLSDVPMYRMARDRVTEMTK